MPSDEIEDYRKLFTGKYLASPDIGASEPTVMIERVVIESVEDEKKGKRDRLILYAHGAKKGMLLNRTNCILIAAMFQTNKPREWVGHHVTIAARDVQMGPDMVKGLRIIGSPELPAPMTVEVNLPKKRPQIVTLAPTGKRK